MRPSARRSEAVELTFLPGLADVLSDEASELLLTSGPPTPVRGRDDALEIALLGPLASVAQLRTAVAAFVVLRFDVPRPKSLTSGDHLQRIVDAIGSSMRVGRSASFRFEAAGSDSAVFQRLAALLAEATGLAYDETGGELVLRVRRGVEPRPSGDPGWDVLVRVGNRPLSARPWRVADYPGAANATIAAAMVRLGGVVPTDRVLNLMCGSGTLLVERLVAGPAAEAVGVDLAPDAVVASSDNLAAAGVRAQILHGDALAAVPGSFDLVLADPPWGTLHGSHESNAALHAGLLRAAYEAAAPGARLVVLTHEIKVMEQAVRDADALWRLRDQVRVFAKGHHPRIWVLDRT
ncbi:methyltransferase [Cellulomonas sp. URHD0024]|uniref:methyltransferase n=1 Tax=Cellulomonas sp. URHD0024 TaxID=1302620 RepID=UPI000425EDE7|nr:methyltransferase [Cellulomonas sp. URHD0024]